MNRLSLEKLLRPDVIVSMGMIGILLAFFVPLPALLLDMGLATSITAAVLILMLSLYTTRALDFSTFPSVLLATTLFRLGLNIATTRLVLLRGHEGTSAAGHVIQAFGQFVVGGNYVVGLVIFIILVIINFVVITKGSGRVAEVAARFTLDAMPGKQMAIDADLGAGLIGENEARARRREIAAEAEFFGAMDGASKFVRGDAIAGIMITLVNIGAGFVIGMFAHGMSAADAAKTYTILTVGDGLVGQIPALIISVAAGLLVTRTYGGDDFGSAIMRQFTLHPRALGVTAAALAIFGLIPGLPHVAFLTLAAAMGYLARRVARTKQAAADLEAAEADSARRKATSATEPVDVSSAPKTLRLEVGFGLIPLVASGEPGKRGAVIEKIKSTRAKLRAETGFEMPPLDVSESLELRPNEYALLLKGVRVAGGELVLNHFLAINPGDVTQKIQGTDTVDPAYGVPSTWITPQLKDRASLAGYSVVDCPTVLLTHLSEVVRRHAHEMLGRQQTQELLDEVAKDAPKLIEETVPRLLSLGEVAKVLQGLLRERVSIRDLSTILETLADKAPLTRDPAMLIEYAREALGRAICQQFVDGRSERLEVFTLESGAEAALTNAVKGAGSGAGLPLGAREVGALVESIAKAVKSKPVPKPVLMTNATLRPHLRRLTERALPRLSVISQNEVIKANLSVHSLATVKVDA